MTVKTKHGDFECRELTFKKRRELHRLEIGALGADGQINLDKYYDVMEFIMSYAFVSAADSLGKLEDAKLDTGLSAIYTRNKKTHKKKK